MSQQTIINQRMKWLEEMIEERKRVKKLYKSNDISRAMYKDTTQRIQHQINKHVEILEEVYEPNSWFNSLKYKQIINIYRYSGVVILIVLHYILPKEYIITLWSILLTINGY